MENKFEEKVFLAAVKQLGNIVPYFSTANTARNFLRLISNHCGFDENDVYGYIRDLIDKNRPDIKETVFAIKGWRRFYECLIKKYTDVPDLGEMLKNGVDFFKTPGAYETYFRLVAETLGVEANPLMDYYICHQTGWIKVVDTLVKIANENDDSETDTSEPVKKSGKKSKEKETVPVHSRETETSSVTVVESAEPVSTADEKPREIKKTPKVRTSESIPVVKVKRGYDLPVLQYMKGETFSDIDSASLKTGIPVDDILTSLENRPEGRVDCIWKYKNSQKKELIQFVYLHTYRNQNDINVSSESVCGKKIRHNNVTPKLKKEWSPVSREEYVWIQLADKDGSTFMESAA